MTDEKKHCVYMNLAGCFLFAFCFTFFSYAGLPVDFTADHLMNMQGTEAIGYNELIRLILNPLTPAWFYPSTGSMAYLRPLQFLLMKLYFHWFHYSLVPFHLTAAIGHGLLAMIFFAFIYRRTRRALYGWLAVILYASFPSNFFTMASTFSMDFQHFVSILTVSGLILFGSLTRGKQKSSWMFCLGVLGWIAAV